MQRKKWKNWGIPYQGSKNRMMSWLSQNIPTSGECFVDLFCGGCAVTHYMMVNGRFDKYIINDVNPMMPKAFVDAINGKFHDERRWISREEFKRSYDNDFYAACCFSFGNNYKNYAYSPSIEPFKKACHYAIMFDDWEKMRLLYPDLANKGEKILSGVSATSMRRKKLVSCLQKELKQIGRCHLQSMESLERIQSLENLTGGY